MKTLRHATVVGNELALSFGDGTEIFIGLEKLRDSCPCASCSGGRSSSNSPAIGQGVAKAATLSEIRQVGSYALHLRWLDGCGAGIYTFEYLFELAG